MTINEEIKNIPFVICGPGRILDSGEIDLAECVRPPDNTFEAIPLRAIPTENFFSMKIGGTTFEVSTHFNTNGRQSVLQQFRDLILSEKIA